MRSGEDLTLHLFCLPNKLDKTQRLDVWRRGTPFSLQLSNMRQSLRPSSRTVATLYPASSRPGSFQGLDCMYFHRWKTVSEMLNGKKYEMELNAYESVNWNYPPPQRYTNPDQGVVDWMPRLLRQGRYIWSTRVHAARIKTSTGIW